jgi:hypothetical protein
MQKRNVLNSPRLTELKKRRRKVVINKILLSLLGLVIVFFLLTYLSCLKNLNITEIQVTGNEIVDTEEVQTATREETAGKYLWLFPKTNILIYPQNSIKDKLQNKFGRIKNVDLSIENNKTLIINITERVAKYTWCGDTPVVGRPTSESSPQCFFLDEEGYIFDAAPYFSGEVYFKFFGRPTPEDNFFFKQNFEQLASFKDALVKLGLKPTSLYVASDGDVEINLLSGSSAITPPKVIFKLDADMQNIKENLEAALNTEPLKSDMKKKYSTLEYIDLRFGNKVYNKFSK